MLRIASMGLLVAALLAGVLGSSNSTRAQLSEDWNKVVEAAKREGTVIVYSAYLSPITHKPIAEAFDRKYGIKVQYLTARGSEMRERIRTEQAAGRFLGDTQHNALTNLLAGMAQEQSMQPLGHLPNAVRLKSAFKARADQFQVPVFTINYGFLINANLVKPGEEPKSWQDLLDPKWKGRILSDDPRASGGGRVMFHMTFDKFGREYHEKLAAQQLVFSRDYGEAVRRVARGEYAIYIPLILSEFQPISRLPVRYVIPREGVTYGSYGVGILKNPPHPNAARLMADFYLSDEVQSIYARTAHGITVEKLDKPLPPEMEKLTNVTPLVPEDFSTIDERFKQAKEIYK
jgi:iron(III) transport system substrate-binding protein